MIPRNRHLLAVLLSLAIGACATGNEPVTSDSDQTSPPEPGQTIPAPPANPSNNPAADAGTEAGRDGGGEYTYGPWSEFSNCSVTCNAGTKARTRECRRRDGLPVNCTHCGGVCTDTIACTASTCCGPREECCPVMPYNVCGGTGTWCTDTLAAFHTKCLAAGCLWTGATSCTIGGSVSNATLPGGMGTCQ